MNHPKPEAWVPYLYGEVKSNERRSLKAHLKGCPECRAQVEQWKRSVDRLDAWHLPRTSTLVELFAPVLKFAAAAVLVLGLGFFLGRLGGREAVTERVRARLEPQLRAELRQEMAQMVRQEIDRNSALVLQASGDQTEKLLAAYNSMNETRRAADLERLYAALKRQLDTVAINTEEGFVQLAGYQPAASESTKP
jgi:anti-sigma factor RsiW